jgi:hypothetical protein
MKGRRINLSAPRRFTIDLLRLASRIPTVPVQRRMQLSEVARARSAAAPRPGWPALFIKAFANVVAEMPELRRAYVCLPRPHLYEYPTVVAGIAVEREYHGEKQVFFGRISRPQDLPLTAIEARIRGLAERPVETIRAYRKMLRVASLPRPLRRFLLWLGLNLPRSRRSVFSTFGLTVYSSLGAESLHPIAPVTTTMTYGVIQADGSVDVRLVYDHRVLDGSTVARALARLDAELNGSICDELRALAGPARSAA